MSTQAANATTEAAPPRRRLRWWGVLLIILGIVLALFFMYRLALEYRVSREIASLRADGYPTNLEEINDRRDPPPDDEANGADLYRRAFTLIVRPPRHEDEHLPVVGRSYRGTLESEDRLPDRSLEAVINYVERHAEPLELLHLAAEAPRVRFLDPIPSDPDRVFDGSQLSNLRAASLLLVVEAMLHIERDDPAAAAAALRATWRVGDALAEDPFLIAYLVRNAIRAYVALQLNRALHHTRFADEQLTMLMDLLTDEADGDMRRAMINERAWGIQHFHETYLEGLELPYDAQLEEWGVRPPAIGAVRLLGLPDLDRLIYIDFMREIIDAASLDWPDRIEAAEAAVDALENSPLLPTGGRWWRSPSRAIAVVEARTIAQLRTARTALAVERHRLAHGELPGSLDELAPRFIEAVPLDPYTGDPLRYKRLDTGYTVYSVGEDRTDHGGRRTAPGGFEFEPGADIPFTVAR